MKGLGADAVVDGRHGDVAAAARAFAPAGARRGARARPAVRRSSTASTRCARADAWPIRRGVHPAPRRAGGSQHRALRPPSRARPEYARLNTAIEAARLKVPIAAQFPLSAAAQAQQRVEAGHVRGQGRPAGALSARSTACRVRGHSSLHAPGDPRGDLPAPEGRQPDARPPSSFTTRRSSCWWR